MKITTNGTETEVEDGITVTRLLSVRDVKMPDMVSVELNGEILERADFGTTIVREGDQVEFLYFMGGGL